MKKKMLLCAFPILLTLCNCTVNTTDTTKYTSFKEYVEIVKNASDEDKNIFVFTSSSCPHCLKIKPLLTKYISKIEDEHLHIYELSVNYNHDDENYQYEDKTMGYLSGDSTNDGLKALDNRLSLFVKNNNIVTSYGNEIFDGSASGSKYIYVFTPLIIWYQGNSEVRFSNNVEAIVEKDKNGNFSYDSFVEFMEFPETKPSWTKEFDLNYFDN